jgi:hypothetical protein
VWRSFQFSIQFFPSKPNSDDGSVRKIERDTIMRWEFTFGEIDPQELQNMEEMAVWNMKEKLGKSAL